MAFLEITGLSKAYDATTVVDSLSLSVGKGEFVCLLGPSGCGKTTTLQMLAGFVAPDRGRIELDGRDITRLRSNQRGLGIVFQSYALFPHMTVAQNVAFGLEMRNVAFGERCTRVADALELVHLGAFAKRYPKELSGGQRQRVAMARALVIQPPVLLLDEPMGALDAKLREDMQFELRALQNRLQITTLMVTHDQAEAMTLADRVVLMNKGRIEQVDQPFDMYSRPNGRFSSTFLGKANVFDGRVGAGGFVVGDTTLPMGPSDVTGDADYIVRPEKVEFCDHDALVRGHVLARAFQGNHWLFQIKTPIGTMQITQVNHGLPLANNGDEVGLRWAPASALVVNKEVLHEQS